MYCCGTIHSDHGMLHLNFEGNLNWWQFKIYSHLVILSQYIIYIIVIKEMSIHYQQYMVSKNLKFRESYGSLYQSYCGIQQICEWSAQMQLLQIITRWKKVFVRLLQLAVINRIKIYHNMKPQLILKHQGHKKLGKTNTPICSTVGRSKCEWKCTTTIRQDLH